MYAELERKCINCEKMHPGKTSFCRRCLDTRARYCKRHPDKILSIKLKHTYGIDLKQYKSMLEAQSGVCMICEKENNRKNYKTGNPERLVVDHDHNTKAIRGLLCHRCNLAVGMHETIGAKIIAYLEKFKN